MVRGLSAVPWALAIAAGAWGAWGTWRAGAELETRVRVEGERDRANESAAASETNRQIEHLFRTEQEERNVALNTRLEAAQDDARSATAAGERLRVQLSRMRAQASAAAPGGPATHPTLVQPGEATGSPAAVLADLLGRCSERREELARYADRLRTAGEACVGDYGAAERAVNKTN